MKRGCLLCVCVTLTNMVLPTGAVPAVKPEATAIGDPQDGR